MANIRPRSKKMESIYATQRRKIVADLLGSQPLCQRCQREYASDVHELKSRARGGSITDLENLVVLCRVCHTWITQNPKLALEQGWLKNSWDD
jgi:5-methylcytosine-specific restriction endonuclease McrA